MRAETFRFVFIFILLGAGATASAEVSNYSSKEASYLKGFIADDGSVDDGTEAEDEEEMDVKTQAEFLDSLLKDKEPENESTYMMDKKPNDPSMISGVKTPTVPGFPTKAFLQALAYMKKYPGSFQNDRYLTIVDFTKPSHKKRLFIVNLKTGGVESRLTSHGKGSDPGQTGRATRFGNTDSSHRSSLGFYRTLGTYQGKNGLSLSLQGLSKTNSNALARRLVFHKAKYVSENGGRAGRSHGCFAMDSKVFLAAIQKIKGGSLVYAWNGQ